MRAKFGKSLICDLFLLLYLVEKVLIMGSKFLESVRQNMRLCGYSLATEKTYLLWIMRFMHFTGGAHPQDVHVEKITAYLTYLASEWLDIRTVQDLLGHNDVKATQIYTHVLGRHYAGSVSPIDQLQ